MKPSGSREIWIKLIVVLGRIAEKVLEVLSK
jgi:hypothetical protein